MNNIEMLRIIADDYEQAQRVRVGKGEQIRSIVRGVDLSVWDPGYKDSDEGEDTEDKAHRRAVDALLEAIKRSESDEPHPYLSWAYRTSWNQERRAFDEMMETVPEHPAWPWLDVLKGVGPTLACKLLARLDIEKATSASSFACYCGLGTVPGKQYRCDECGRTDIYPESYNVTGNHTKPGSTRKCKGISVQTAGPEDGVRAAQPKGERGESRSYDAYAKKIMYLIAGQFVKQPGRSWYEHEYRSKRNYYERERPGWEKGRKHFSALRHIEKLFLSHLYETWCEAIGQTPARPYAEKHLGHDGIVGAWDVIEWEKRAAEKAA